MRSVLVCVRTPLAAQHIAAAAARLGVTAAVRTAVSDSEAMLRLAERPADVVLADTAVTRPDSVGFTRRALARSPGAAILLIGAEDPAVAAATIAAGARGLLQGGDHDLVSVVAKAILLLGTAGRPSRGGPLAAGGLAGGGAPGRAADGAEGGPASAGHRLGSAVRAPSGTAAGAGGAGPDPATLDAGAEDRTTGREEPSAGPRRGAEPGPRTGAAGEQIGAPAVVPAQRGDDGPDTAGEPAAGPESGGPAAPAGGAPVGPGEHGAGGAPAANRPGRGPAPRRPVLTEREMQVLLGMADGKSNAEIGRELFVSEDTVKTHARRLFRKLGARDRAHAVAAGFRAGLVS